MGWTINFLSRSSFATSSEPGVAKALWRILISKIAGLNLLLGG